MSMNPYSAPAYSVEVASSTDRIDSRGIILGWERKRLLYNVILLPFGLLIAWAALRFGLWPGEVVIWSITMAFCATACYFAGPLFEWYACTFRPKASFSKTGRLMLWLVGLLVSLGVFGLAYLSLEFSSFYLLFP